MSRTFRPEQRTFWLKFCLVKYVNAWELAWRMPMVAGLAVRLPASNAAAGGAGMISVQDFLTKEVIEWR
jgi:hypothetical protein